MSGWLKEHTVAALTVLGLLLYGVIRLSYATFYDAFGVEPEEVGIDYKAALTKAWPSLVTTFVVWLGVTVLLLGVMALGGWAWRRVRPRAEPSDPAMWATIFAAIAGFLLLNELPARAETAAHDVKAGETPPLTSGLLDWDALRNPLSLRVEHVRLHWVGGEPPPTLGARPGGVVTYLGRTSDTVVVYDPLQKRTLRIPASTVVVSKPEQDSGRAPAHAVR